tara:strand:+ start:735 stop:953 length:219 start_codon:yes stop_codon:yes gene_type:complete
MGWFFPDIFSVDEQNMSYDMSRAHSADVWLLKVRFWCWGITAAAAALLIGNIMGALGFSIFGTLIELITELL